MNEKPGPGAKRESRPAEAGRAASPAAAPGDPEPAGLPFEQALERLEALVRELESGELPLEETIERFEEGQTLLRTCTDLLSRAELKVKEILDRAGGSPAERDWSAGDEPDEPE